MSVNNIGKVPDIIINIRLNSAFLQIDRPLDLEGFKIVPFVTGE